MILSRLFTKQANYKHKKNTIRILAINEELSITSDENILLSLANDDQDELVRRAALLKLNTFEHWYYASNNNSLEKVKLFAEKQIEKYIRGQNTLALTEQQKQALLNEKQQTAFLELWLFQENSADYIVKIFTQLALQSPKKQRLMQLFERCQYKEVRQFLIAQTDDINPLEKMLKKAVNDCQSEEITQCLQTKIQALKVQIEKPQKVYKEVQLLLSKYLALKEQADFAYYDEKKSLFKQQWQILQADLVYLSSDDKSIFETKFDQIEQQLTKIFAPKAEVFQQAKIAQQLVADKAQASANFNQTIQEINQTISTAVFENTQLDLTVFSSQLNSLEQDIVMSVLSTKQQQSFINQLHVQQKRLTNLPEIAESVSQATYHISKISQLALPKSLDELNKREEVFEAWLEQWHEIERKSDGVLPDSIKKSSQEVLTTWRNGLADFKQQQKKQHHQCKKKLKDLQRLISQGKYKASFGVFKGVKSAYILLNAQQQQYLKRDYDDACHKMAEVSDWEHYIATPRKQQLLDEIQTLIESPLDNPIDQAEKVKSYRKTWNSLGHAEEEVDQRLNDQFNVACEQAFTPCRLFYAEQDKIRAQHLVIRKNIVDQAKALAEPLSLLINNDTIINSIDYKSLENSLNKLQQQWRSAGDVDRENYQTLQNEFNQFTKPIKQFIKEFQQNNAMQKQVLIKQAQQAILIDDVFFAIETVKQLQQQWRSVDSAGHHQENKLWQIFRKANDEVFAKRDAIKNEQQQQQRDFKAQQLAKLTIINQKLDLQEGVDLATCKMLIEDTESLLRDAIANKPVMRSLVQNIEKTLKQLEKRVGYLQQTQKKQCWLALFDVLGLISKQAFNIENTQNNTEPYISLNSFWQKRIANYLINTENMVSRDEQSAIQLLRIEILASKESPQIYAKQRLALQVELLQQQMTSAEPVDLVEQLEQWLQLGKLTESDLLDIERLSIVFCSSK